MPLPCVGQLVDDRVDLVLGADIDAARRLVEDQHLGVGEQPLRQHHLLLVAAGEVAGHLVDARRADVASACGSRWRPCSSRMSSITPAVETPGEVGERDVVLDVVDQDQAVGLAVLGDVGEAVRRPRCRRCETSTGLPCSEHLAGDARGRRRGRRRSWRIRCGPRPSGRRCRRPRRARTLRLTSLITCAVGDGAGGRRSSPSPRRAPRRSSASRGG